MDSTRTKPRRRFRILLALSLALNLLFVGLIAGALWRGGGSGGGGARMAGMQNYAAPYVQALPREQRRALYQNLRAEHPRIGRKERRAGYDKMIAALRATPFDPVALETIVQEQATFSAAVAQTGQAGWLAALRKMTEDERAAYADRLEDRIKHAAKHKRRKKDG